MLCDQRKRGSTCSSLGTRHSRRNILLVDVYVLPVYYDCGVCCCVCECCGALCWFHERVLYLSQAYQPCYTECCNSGFVVIPYPLPPPHLLLEYFEGDHFMRNIRAYNSMFSMTSFGAQLDDSIKKGNSPYVFKVSFQIFIRLGRSMLIQIFTPSNFKREI